MSEGIPEAEVIVDNVSLEEALEDVKVLYADVQEKARRVKLIEDDLRNARTLLNDAESDLYRAKDRLVQCAVAPATPSE